MGGRSGQRLQRAQAQSRPTPQAAPIQRNQHQSDSGPETAADNQARNTPERTIRAMAGIPDGVPGAINIRYNTSGRVFVRFMGEGIEMDRILDFRTQTAYNEYFRISEGSPHKGRGYEIFAKQVKALQKAKFKEIGVSAAGSPRSSVYNGYYTWARFGYRPANAESLVRQINEGYGTSFRTWYEMMNTKTGQDLWKRGGNSFYGYFDLSPRSDSVKTLNNYLKYRKSKGKN